RLMRRFLLIALLAIAIALLVTRAEPLAPTVVLETPVDVVGRATPLVVVARDRGTGLAHVEVRLAAGAGGAPAGVASEDFPRRCRRRRERRRSGRGALPGRAGTLRRRGAPRRALRRPAGRRGGGGADRGGGRPGRQPAHRAPRRRRAAAALRREDARAERRL